MTPELYRRASDLFHEVRELPESERAAALESACGGDDELRAQVERLLKADRVAAKGAFLDGRAIEDAARVLARQSLGLPTPGAVIGRFRLDQQIGRGGMGVVYKAEDLHLHRPVAIKILLIDAVSDTERVQRFQREARAVSLLNHPNIVSILDADRDQGWHYIAMELVEGQTLRQLIGARRPIESKTVLDLISQTASALHAAHEAGIVHRDIKPENLMLRPDGIVKVLDFGLAKLRERDKPPGTVSELHTGVGNVPGTLQYLSPEQVLGEPAGPRSDLFSLGVVSYELATGVRPFDGSTDGGIFNAVLNRIPPPPSSIQPSVSSDLDALILRLLEKDPDLRFQTAGDLRSSCRRLTRDYSAIPTPASSQKIAASEQAAAAIDRAPAKHRSRRFWLVAGAAALAALVGVAVVWQQPLSTPRVTGIVQITPGRSAVGSLVTDGVRIYYAVGPDSPGGEMFQISTKGGEPIPMPRLNGMFPLDISADRSEILLGQFVNHPSAHGYPLWIADTLGNPPRRLGTLTAAFARWSPRGDEIAYTSLGPDLHIARRDGLQSRVVASLKGLLQSPVWSPDGRLIRFTVVGNPAALWEVASDGTGLRRLLPQWTEQPQENGVWTPNGKYFVFSGSIARNVTDLWALPESAGLFRLRVPSPIRLTHGPMMATHPAISPDGRRIFFRGALEIGELVRYDPKSRQWTPHLGGLAASQLEYSRDRRWVTYVSHPEGAVWRAASDGSQRLQLTEPPLYAVNPRWSPDGTQITAFGGLPGKPSHIFLITANGGAVRQLTHGEGGPGGETDGSWSPDGTSIVFGVQSADQAAGRHQSALRVIDVRTERSSVLPGSQGLWSPRWSPDGRWIAALGFPNKLWLYDLQAHRRTEIASFSVGFPSWSQDSKYVYFEDSSISNWYRVRVADGKLEHLASMAGLRPAPSCIGWIGLTPDGSLMATQDKGSVEIYALDWDLP